MASLFASNRSVAQETQTTTKAGLSDSDRAKANNPLAKTKAFSVHYYYRPNLTEIEGAEANTTWIRAATPTGRILWRASVPIESRTVSNSTTSYSESGIGDLDIFAAYLAVMKPKLTFGIGPSASFNTASDDALGSGKNTLGFAAVLFANINPRLQVGGLVTWRTDIGGDEDRDDVNIMAIQPFGMVQAGSGVYFRGAPIMTFNLDNGDYTVPLGLGAGKIMKINSVVYNFFAEAQPTILYRGAGQPTMQVYAGLNLQF